LCYVYSKKLIVFFNTHFKKGGAMKRIDSLDLKFAVAIIVTGLLIGLIANLVPASINRPQKSLLERGVIALEKDNYIKEAAARH